MRIDAHLHLDMYGEDAAAAAIEAQVHDNFLALVDGDDRLLEPFRRAAES